jgi:hypothetical protein
VTGASDSSADRAGATAAAQKVQPHQRQTTVRAVAVEAVLIIAITPSSPPV